MARRAARPVGRRFCSKRSGAPRGPPPPTLAGRAQAPSLAGGAKARRVPCAIRLGGPTAKKRVTPEALLNSRGRRGRSAGAARGAAGLLRHAGKRERATPRRRASHRHAPRVERGDRAVATRGAGPVGGRAQHAPGRPRGNRRWAPGADCARTTDHCSPPAAHGRNASFLCSRRSRGRVRTAQLARRGNHGRRKSSRRRSRGGPLGALRTRARPSEAIIVTSSLTNRGARGSVFGAGMGRVPTTRVRREGRSGE